MLECVHFLLSVSIRCMSISEKIRNLEMTPRGVLVLEGQ